MIDESLRIAELERRLEEVESLLRLSPAPARRDDSAATPSRHSRRGLLKLAGAGLAGAAGASVAGALPASAADGQSILLGSTGNAQNHMTSSTTITSDPGSYVGTNSSAVVVDASATGVALTATGGASGLAAVVGFGPTNGLWGHATPGTGGNPPHAGVVGVGGAAGTAAAGGGTGLRGFGGDAPGFNGPFPGYGVIGSGGSAQASGGSGGFGVSGQGGAGNAGPGGTGLVAAGGMGTPVGSALYIQPAGGSIVGPPTTHQHFVGEVFSDSLGVIYMCVATGTPGTFAPLQMGGLNRFLYKTAITTQPELDNSDGVTWTDIDSTNLKLTLTPAISCLAVLFGSADLWTANAGFNQDLGITLSGPSYPTTAGQPEAWKEAGGNGTFAPTAAMVMAVVPLAAGSTYTATLQWKTNKPTPGGQTSKIHAGAGPIGGKYSPTSLVAYLVPA